MAKRLIDANALIAKFERYRQVFLDGWGGFSNLLSDDKARVDEMQNCIAQVINAPTVDAVEVVRCRDCRWRGSEQCAMFYSCDCGEQHTWETDGDFCSYGERKGGQAPQREDV